MPRKEYNPRVNNYRPESSLRATVSSNQISSYDEKRADWVWQNREAGDDWRQLARTLSGLQPTLAQYAEDKQRERNQENRASLVALTRERQLLGESATQIIQAAPEYLAKWPPARNVIHEVYYEGVGREARRLAYAFYDDQGLANKSGEEFNQALDAWELELRDGLEAQGLGEDSLQARAAVFDPAVRKIREELSGRHSADHNQAEFQRLGQEAREGFLPILTDAFRPGRDGEEAGREAANLLGRSVEALAAQGVPRHTALEWVRQSVMQFAQIQELEGEDDFRDYDVMDTLDYIPTETGFLGQTAESLAERERTAEANRTRRIARENRRKADKELKNEELAKTFGRAFLAGQADYQAVCAAGGYDPADPEVSETWNKTMSAQAAAAEVVETPTNRQYVTELELRVLSGEAGYADIQEAFKNRRLTARQKDHLISRKSSVEGREPAVNRLASQAGLGEALGRISAVLTKSGRQDENINLSDNPGQISLVATRQQIAGELLTRQVLAELYALEGENIPDFTRERKARQIVNDATAYFLGEGRETVFEAADKALADSFQYRAAVTGAYAEMGRHRTQKTAAPVFKPAPGSILADLSETEIAWADHYEKARGLPESSLLTFVAVARKNGLTLDASTPEAMDYWASLIQNQAEALRRAGSNPTPAEIMEMILPGYGDEIAQAGRERFQQQLRTITPALGARLPDLEAAAQALSAFERGERAATLDGLEEEFKRLGVPNPSRQLLSQALHAVYIPLYNAADEKRRKKARKITQK